MAAPAVSLALSKFKDTLSSSSCGADQEQVEELVTELTWMQCFLVDGEKRAQGRARTDVWSSAIQRLAVSAQQLQSGGDNKGFRCREIDYLNKRLSRLREKIQCSICCQVQSVDSATVTGTQEEAAEAYNIAAIKFRGINAVTNFFISRRKFLDSGSSRSAHLVPSGGIQLTAWGGPGGVEWFYAPIGMIKQITVVYAVVIDSITFTSFNEEGKLEDPVKIGGSGGNRTDQVNINVEIEIEYMTGISGTIGVYDNVNVIKSSIHTNLTSYGPYGSTDGTSFSFKMEDGMIVGFCGRSAVFLDAIGVFVASL